MKFSLFATVSALFATAMVTGAAPTHRQTGNGGLVRNDQRWQREIIPERSQLRNAGYTETILKNRYNRGARDDQVRAMFKLGNDPLSRYSHRERHGQPKQRPTQPEQQQEQEARVLSASQRVNGALRRAHEKDQPNSDRSAAARNIKQSIQNSNPSN
ncbi:hypothetical protein BASA50_007217 [Batrachochytrium salamandrivorans]|uniref:Uncharacterized protein n=1 Tax=Batrachochytrium salamandrivorans TaxID=1357716 RepID=A0ABQ8FAL2_9FUNG|nr:hypothetical protein BASA50_007217 [Batrachochytrium salamandrivorans]